MDGALIGHVGDGNFHAGLLFTPGDAGELAEVKRLSAKWAELALELGGTCTGEHGIGSGKMHFLEAEHGPEGLALMRAVKQALDPLNIMNPGKIVLV